MALELGTPVDARELCEAWAIARPVAVSPDVHQRTWSILEAGVQLPDPHGKRIASDPITAGRWRIVPKLGARPAGALPDVVSGASPAYDVGERGGEVTSIEIAPTEHIACTREPGHADAQRLLDSMRSVYAAWRGGWNVDLAATFVVIYDEKAPVAGAAVIDRGELACASELSVARGGDGFGIALLDALEALARDRGAARLRLDSSAFLFGDELPLARYGYEVGPPYDGDADVDVWAEKEL